MRIFIVIIIFATTTLYTGTSSNKKQSVEYEVINITTVLEKNKNSTEEDPEACSTCWKYMEKGEEPFGYTED